MKKRLQQSVALLRGDSRHYSRCSMPFSRCSTPAESGMVSRQVGQIGPLREGCRLGCRLTPASYLQRHSGILQDDAIRRIDAVDSLIPVCSFDEPI